MQVRLALFVSALLAAFSLSAAAALAVPGDPGIADPVPGQFRLNPSTLEPGCYQVHRGDKLDVDSHLVFSEASLTSDAHITVDNGSPYSVDQVLVPSPIDGYSVVNTFETGLGSDPAIDPGQTAFGIVSPTRFVDVQDIIVCVSHHGDAAQNEPYQQEDGGLVSAKNRPVVVPKVTAIGMDPNQDRDTYKIGFGYSVQSWYSRPAFETDEDGNALFASVTDPNALPSPTYGADLPGLVGMFPRPADFPYDAQRVNDVDKNGESWFFPTPRDSQSVFFKQGGDNTAWIDGDTPFRLIATTTQGDLPISWTLRPSLGAPDTEKSTTLTDEQLRQWDRSWQLYYAGKGPNPRGKPYDLLPGTDSPRPDRSYGPTVNPQVSVPATGATPAPVTTSTTASTTTIVQQAPAASSTGARSAAPSSAKKSSSRASIRSARVVKTKQGKRLQVFVKSAKKTARITIRMYDAKGRKVGQVTKTVRTNRTVKVAGVRIARKVKIVKVALAG